MEQPGVLLWVFHSTFWAFSCISKAPFDRSLWSGRHWKDLFLLQKLSIDGANFGQNWWRQKRNNGQGSSRAVTGGKGVNRLIKAYTLQTKGAFLLGDLDQDQWSKICLDHGASKEPMNIIHDQSGFTGSFDAPWSRQILDNWSDPDHPKGTQPNTFASCHRKSIQVRYLRNRKHVPCFYRVIQTRVEVWENEKCCVSTAFSSSPKLSRVFV